MLLPDIADEVFRFFDRSFLTRLQLLGRGLRDTVDRICPEFPLHRIHRLHIEIAPNGQCTLDLNCRRTVHNNLTVVASRITDFLLHAYVCRCQIGDIFSDGYAMQRAEWTYITDSLRRAHVEAFEIRSLDLTSLEDEAISCLLDGPSVASLCVERCIVRPTFVDDAFLAKCSEKQITSLSVLHNKLANGQHFQPGLSEEALLDFCARGANASYVEVHLKLSRLQRDSLFLQRLLKVLVTEQIRFKSPLRCYFIGAIKQQHLEPFEKHQKQADKLIPSYVFELPMSPDSTDFHRIEYHYFLF